MQRAIAGINRGHYFRDTPLTMSRRRVMVLIVLRHSRSLLRSKIDVLSAKCGLRNLDNISEMVSRFNTVICLKTTITIHGQPHPRRGCQAENLFSRPYLQQYSNTCFAYGYAVNATSL